jgi:hypothetical protein
MTGLQRAIRLKNATASGVGQANLINVPRLFSQLNSKYMAHTDAEGNALSYPYRLSFKSGDDPSATGRLEIITTEIPNSWKMRNAVRRWHFSRREMFSRAGIRDSELGRYGKLLRPYMDDQHQKGAWTELNTFDYGTSVGAASWRYTEIASNLDWGDEFSIAQSADFSLIDKYNIHVCGSHIDEVIPDPSETKLKEYTSVGMIQSYNQDRMEVVTPVAGEALNPENPLASLDSNDATGGEVSDVALAQEIENPPYDIQDDGTSIVTVTTGFCNGPNNGAMTSVSGMAALGYILFTTNQTAQVYIEIGEPVLSKDC